MRLKARSIFVGGLLLIMLGTAPVQAQYWGQTVQVITPLQSDEPLSVFTRSLSDFLVENPNVRVRRSPQDTSSVPFSDLREKLFEDGVSVTSASHVIVQYRFDMNQQLELVETVEHVNFIYRADEARSDLPLLYIDPQDPTFADFMRSNGMESPINAKSMTSFRQILSFPHVNRHPERTIVEIGNQALRGEKFSARKRKLVDLLTGESEMSPTSYALNTEKSIVLTPPLVSEIAE